jgi:hypothetical protein
MRWVLFAGLLLMALLSSGCSHLDKEINKRYPPKTSVDAQVEVTQTGLQSISQFSSPNAVVAASAKDWQERLETVITSSVPQTTKATVTFGKQEIIVSIEFSGTFPLNDGESVSLTGESQIHLALAVQSSGSLGGTTNLTLSPTFKRVVLTKASYSRWRIPDGLVDLVVGVLNRYIDNINGAIGQRAFSFTTEFLQQFDPAVFTAGGQNDVASVYGKPIFLRTYVAQSALLIDEQSLRVLLEIGSATADEIGAALASVDPSAARSLTQRAMPTEKTAALLNALCVDSLFRSAAPSAAAPDAQRGMQALNAHCAQAEAQAKGAALTKTAVATSSSGDEFERLYAEYRTKFDGAQQAGLGQSLASPGQSFAAISRRFVAGAINAIGREAEIGVDIRLPDSSMPFDEELKLQPAPNLNCGSIVADCMPNFSCSQRCDGQFGSCSGRQDCPSSCNWYDVGCHAWKVTCEVLKVGEIAVCNAAKGVCLGACEGEKALKAAACLAETEARKLGCNLNQAWLNAWGNQKIGRVDGTVGLRAGALNLLIKSEGGTPAFSVGENLDAVSLRASLAASSDVRSSIRYTPLDLGHLLCVARWSGEVRARIVAGAQSFAPSGTISWLPFGDSLRLLATFSPITIPVQMQPGPIQALFEQNPHVAVICAPAVILGLSAQLTGELISAVTGKPNQLDLLKDKFEWSSGAMSMPMVIEPMGINFPAASNATISPRVSLVPSVSDRALVFRARVAN